MITLGIETSCDETALALLETVEVTREVESEIKYRILAQSVFSQIDIHAEYGGVFPIVAKREHSRRLVPMLEHIFQEAAIPVSPVETNLEKIEQMKQTIHSILSEKEPELLSAFLSSDLLKKIPAINTIDRIAVTIGPGLEPALWVGVNFARALSAITNIPILPVNHMEGHIVGSFMPDAVSKKSGEQNTLTPLITPKFPAIALLISGGHTELVKIRNIGDYEIIGATLDDAVGEAFDKVARMMNIPYPGGPVISQLAAKARAKFTATATGTAAVSQNPITLPRPMLHSPDLNFSFSGLKTSVLYLIEKLKKDAAVTDKKLTEISLILSPELTENIALAFEDAVTEVLVTKTKKALENYEAYTLILGGGVAANAHIREVMGQLAKDLNIELLAPCAGLSGDNALMIALAGALTETFAPDSKKATLGAALSASGKLSL